MYAKPIVEIVEEPTPRASRFRYKTESQSSPLEGVNSTKQKRTHPSIKISNYTGKATILVSCVTKDKPYRHHPHELVGKNCENGYFKCDFSTDSKEPTILSFTDLRVQCSKSVEFTEILNQRKSFNDHPFQFSQYEDQSKTDIHTVRLCFLVFIKPDPKNPKHTISLDPVVSQRISDKNDATELKIHDISDASSSVSGGKKIMIFCDKISKKDIEIRFYAEDAEKKEIRIGSGSFQPHNVHHDVAISFTTPKCELKDVDMLHNVFVELIRPSDNARSNRISFQYVSDLTNIDAMIKRKQRKVNESNNFFEFIGLPRSNNIASNIQGQYEPQVQKELLDPPQLHDPEKQHIEYNPQTCTPLQTVNTPQKCYSSQTYNPQRYHPHQHDPRQYLPQQQEQKPNELHTAFDSLFVYNTIFPQESLTRYSSFDDILLLTNDYPDEYSMFPSNDTLGNKHIAADLSSSDTISNIDL